MKRFPEELGKLGFVFNFITTAATRSTASAAERVRHRLKAGWHAALARLQRKFRLLESPYRTPQSLVGGPRLDAALMASSGRTAATKAMARVRPVSAPGADRSPHQTARRVARGLEQALRLQGQNSRPVTSAYLGSELLELSVLNQSSGEETRQRVFAYILDRRGRHILSVRDQNTLAPVRKKRLMTVTQLFLIHATMPALYTT